MTGFRATKRTQQQFIWQRPQTKTWMQSSVANTLMFIITAKEEQDDKENKQIIEPYEPKST